MHHFSDAGATHTENFFVMESAISFCQIVRNQNQAIVFFNASVSWKFMLLLL